MKRNYTHADLAGLLKKAKAAAAKKRPVEIPTETVVETAENAGPQLSAEVLAGADQETLLQVEGVEDERQAQTLITAAKDCLAAEAEEAAAAADAAEPDAAAEDELAITDPPEETGAEAENNTPDAEA